MPSSTSSSSARHAVRGAFIALWCGMLALPIALKASSSLLGRPHFKDFPRFENRNPHHFPVLPQTPHRKIGAAVDDWYNDNYAFRTDVVAAYRDVLYNVLRTPVNREVPGRGDWVFRRGGPQGDDDWAELDDYLGAFELTPDELDAWRTFFEGRCEWARAHGILYLELVTSVKAQVQLDEIPPIIRAHRGHNVSAQVQEALHGSPCEHNVLFLGDALREVVASGHDAYYHDDHHPAPYGMWLQFDVLNHRLREDFPALGDMPFYDEDSVPAEVLAGLAPGCYPRDSRGGAKRLAVSSPGTRQVYDDVPPSSRRYPYVNVATENDAGGISILVAHDSFLRFSLCSWRGNDGDVRFPFAPGVGRVDARIFARYTTEGLESWTAKRLPDVVIEQFPECRLNKNLIGFDKTMRRAAAFGRAQPLDPGAPSADSDAPLLVLAVLDNLRTSPDMPDDELGKNRVKARLFAGDALVAEENALTGVRRAIFFESLDASKFPPNAEFRVELSGGVCDGRRIEVRR